MAEEGLGRSVEDLEITFGRKAVYYYWHVISREEWKLADDPFESARRFIEERGDEHNVALLDVPEEPGTRVVAFQVTDFMRVWAKNTQELGMDSTCKESLNLRHTYVTDMHLCKGEPMAPTLRRSPQLQVQRAQGSR